MNEVRVIGCEEALWRLFEYLDAELHGDSRQEMEQHLERCRSCFSRLEFETRLKTRMRQLGNEPISRDLAQRIHTLLDSFES